MNAIVSSLSPHRPEVIARSIAGLSGLRMNCARELGIWTLIADQSRAPHRLHTRTNIRMHDVVLLDPAHGVRPTTPIIVFGDDYWALTGDTRTELLYRLAVLELVDLLVMPDDPAEMVEVALDWFDDRYPDRARHIIDREVAARDYFAWRAADRVFEAWFVDRFVNYRLVMG